MPSIKTISEAIITRLGNKVTGLNSAVFDGDPRDFLDQVKTVPFAALTLESIEHEDPDISGRVAVERLTFNLLLIAESFSGAGYSIESCYATLDSVRDALMGWSPATGASPIIVERGEKNRQMEAKKITAYDFRFRTDHVVQQTS